MKKIIRKVILPVALLTGCGSYSLASDPVWQTLGEGLHYGFKPCIAIDHNDIPYVAYIYNRQANVMKYNGSSWEYVGNENFTNGVYDSFSMAINSQGIPYVAYHDETTGQNWGHFITSMKYNGVDAWEVVGKKGFGGVAYDDTSYTALAIDNDDIPHVVSSKTDYFGGYTLAPVVYTFKYGSWYQKAVGGSFDKSQSNTITVAKDNTQYVAYSQGSEGAKLTVRRKKVNSSSYSTLGSQGFTDGAVSYISLATDSSSTPYVAFRDASKSYNATVMKFNDNNNTWTPVGQAGFTTSSAKNLSLAIDGSDTLYMAYATNEPGNISVMKYDGNNWVNIGAAYFVNGLLYHSLALDSKGTPYIVYKANDGADGGKVTVMYAPSITCIRTDQSTGECIPDTPDPGWTGPYPEVPFDGNYDQGDGIDEGDRTLEPEVPQPYPPVPCDGTHEQGTDECVTP